MDRYQHTRDLLSAADHRRLAGLALASGTDAGKAIARDHIASARLFLDCAAENRTCGTKVARSY